MEELILSLVLSSLFFAVLAESLGNVASLVFKLHQGIEHFDQASQAFLFIQQDLKEADWPIQVLNSPDKGLKLNQPGNGQYCGGPILRTVHFSSEGTKMGEGINRAWYLGKSNGISSLYLWENGIRQPAVRGIEAWGMSPKLWFESGGERYVFSEIRKK